MAKGQCPLPSALIHTCTAHVLTRQRLPQVTQAQQQPQPRPRRRRSGRHSRRSLSACRSCGSARRLVRVGVGVGVSGSWGQGQGQGRGSGPRASKQRGFFQRLIGPRAGPPRANAASQLRSASVNRELKLGLIWARLGLIVPGTRGRAIDMGGALFSRCILLIFRGSE